MKYYKVTVCEIPFKYDFIIGNDITKEEFKHWFSKKYPKTILKIKEVDKTDIDTLWAFCLNKIDGEIKFI